MSTFSFVEIIYTCGDSGFMPVQNILTCTKVLGIKYIVDRLDLDYMINRVDLVFLEGSESISKLP